MPKYFKYAFAVDGNKTPVLNPTQVGGIVSWQQGYGPDYQKNRLLDPSAKVMPRLQDNQIKFDITDNVKQYQEHGVPEFITTADNDGVAFPYTKDAFVRWDNGSSINLYQSLVGSNSTLPSDITKWRLIDTTGSAGRIAYVNRTFEGTVVDGDVVYYNTGASNFQKAIANGLAAQRVVGVADVTNGRIIGNGDVTILSGLTAGAQYYLSGGSAGAITATAPTFNAVPIGVAISATELLLNISPLSPSLNQIYVGASMYMTAAQTVSSVTPTYTILTFDTVLAGYDPYSMANTSTNRITAPVAGFYEVGCALVFNGGAAMGADVAVSINGVISPVKFKLSQSLQSGAGFSGLSGVTTVLLAAGDYVQIAMTVTGSSAIIDVGPIATKFDMHLLGR